jgi:hypothetical protein
MPTLNFVIKNKKNKGLIINSKELLTLYFYGIDIVNQQGTGLNPDTIDTYIKRCQDEVEKMLTIKLNKQVIEETSDYDRQEFQGTGFVKTKFTVTYPFQIQGWVGAFKQLEYPKEWLTSNKVDGVGTNRQMIVVPNSNVNSVSLNAALFAGSVLPHLGLVNTTRISGYWHTKYITGYDVDHVPYDILEIIGKMASINLLNILGDLILGPGISSTSLGIDGLSQSITSTNSSTNSAFAARITMYQKEIDLAMKNLRGLYKGISFVGI